MNWTQTIFEVIDMRSFSNLWFWIMLALFWSTMSHRVMGVPFDMVARAKRHGGQAMTDFEDMVRINVNRMMLIARISGVWILGGVCFVLTVLGLLAFWYRIEFAQAVFLLVLPFSIVGLMDYLAARKIERDPPRGLALCSRIVRLRFGTQVVGMISIFVTAMYGMYRNLSVAPGFGGF